MLSPQPTQTKPPANKANPTLHRIIRFSLFTIVRQKSVGYLLRGTRSSGASHKRYPTLIYRSLLSGNVGEWIGGSVIGVPTTHRARAAPRTEPHRPQSLLARQSLSVRAP